MPITQPPPPRRMVGRRKNPAGYTIPWFVDDGTDDPDFRIIPQGKIAYAIRHQRCWLCGLQLGVNRASVVGPMCAINRTSSEPPSHPDCASWAAIACPFLSNPSRRRRTTGLPDEHYVAGVSIDRNPGVALVWVSKGGGPFRPPGGRDLVPSRGPHPDPLVRTRARRHPGRGRGLDRLRAPDPGRGRHRPGQGRGGRPDRRSGSSPPHPPGGLKRGGIHHSG